MTREEYIINRNDGNVLELIYNFYLENHKGGIKLDFHDFVQLFPLWPYAVEVRNNLFKYLDFKFNVTRLEIPKTGQILKFY